MVFNQLACLGTKKNCPALPFTAAPSEGKVPGRDGETEVEIYSNDSVFLPRWRKTGLMMPSLFVVDTFFEGR